MTALHHSHKQQGTTKQLQSISRKNNEKVSKTPSRDPQDTKEGKKKTYLFTKNQPEPHKTPKNEPKKVRVPAKTSV